MSKKGPARNPDLNGILLPHLDWVGFATGSVVDDEGLKLFCVEDGAGGAPPVRGPGLRLTVVEPHLAAKVLSEVF